MKTTLSSHSLIQKYNVPGPRYTSYPTVPYWSESPTESQWRDRVGDRLEKANKTEGISLYIHLPYCESLCTFCGCHKHISKHHHVEGPYIKTLIKEWQLYLALFTQKPKIKEIHLGGGTPTFFSPDHLEELITAILQDSEVAQDHEFSFEGHPNNTTQEHLQRLYDLGFRRNSFGVQDYDPIVQKIINRIQPFEHVRQVTDWSREIGYHSVGHDLVFGLPKQRLDSVMETMRLTQALKPDRIAFYSYAHVPWIKGLGQRGFDENDLPKDADKRQLYEDGKAKLEEIGYVEIGMDHFALPTDSLHRAMEEGKLHRNFMGYTSHHSGAMIGLGMSAISDVWDCFAQNVKQVREYTELVNQGQLPIFRGHLLSDEDLVVRQIVLDAMCRFEADLAPLGDELPAVVERLLRMESDGLIHIQDGHLLQVTEAGKAFVRNACMAFDLRLLRSKPTTELFSKTI